MAPRRNVNRTPRRGAADEPAPRASSPAAAAMNVAFGVVSPSAVQRVPSTPRQGSPLNPSTSASRAPVSRITIVYLSSSNVLPAIFCLTQFVCKHLAPCRRLDISHAPCRLRLQQFGFRSCCRSIDCPPSRPQRPVDPPLFRPSCCSGHLQCRGHLIPLTSRCRCGSFSASYPPPSCFASCAVVERCWCAHHTPSCRCSRCPWKSGFALGAS